MLIQFDERFSLPLEQVFLYFQDPASWVDPNSAQKLSMQKGDVDF